MTLAEATDAIQLLAKYLGRTISDEAVRTYAQAFASYSREDLGDGLTTWMQSHGSSSLMPSVQEIRQAIAETKRKRWEHDKDIESHTPLADLYRGTKGMVHECVGLIVKRLAGKIAPADYVAELRALDLHYPERMFRGPRSERRGDPNNFREAADLLELAHAGDDAARTAARLRQPLVGGSPSRRSPLPHDPEAVRKAALLATIAEDDLGGKR